MRWIGLLVAGALVASACTSDAADGGERSLSKAGEWGDGPGCAEATWDELDDAAGELPLDDLEQLTTPIDRALALDRWYDAMLAIFDTDLVAPELPEGLGEFVQLFIRTDLPTVNGTDEVDPVHVDRFAENTSAWTSTVLDQYLLACTTTPADFSEPELVDDLDLPSGVLQTWDLREGEFWRQALPEGDDRQLANDDGAISVVSPGGHLLATYLDGAIAITDRDGNELRSIARGAADFACVTWADDERAILSIGGPGSRAIMAATIGAAEPEPLVDQGSWECAVELDDGRIVATDVREETAKIVMIDGDSTEVVLADDRCNLLVRSLRSDDSVVFLAACDDPRQSGLLRWDPNRDEVEHVVPGRVGVNSWSPDGRFVAYALQPVDSFATNAVVHILDRERNATQLVAGPGRSFPLLLLD